MKFFCAIVLIVFLTVILTHCSTVRRGDYEKKVMVFIDQFEKNLTSSDEIILKQFKVEKSEEAVMKAIRIMQNAESGEDSVSTSVAFKNAQITFEDIDIRVDISAVHQSTDESFPLEKQSTFSLWLASDNGYLYINKIEADAFYWDYEELARDLRNQKHRSKDIASRQLFFEQAKVLRETYDSIIWYTQYEDSIYYYVVNGSWRNYFLRRGEEEERPSSYAMGLVSETGRVIVPPSYDLVGTIGFVRPGLIEVKKSGRVGYFTIAGQELTPSQYDWIIPYEIDHVHALVRQDSLYGWLDESYTYHLGFPDTTAENFITEFQFLSNEIVINKDAITMTEILDIDNMGFGIVMPPSYLTSNGVFDEIEADLYIGDNALGWGGVEYVKTQGSFYNRVTENLSALFVLIEGSYLEGREEFYRHKNLTFLDEKGRSMGSHQVYYGNNIVTKIDSTLLQVKATVPASVAMDYWDMKGTEEDWNTPDFEFFQILKEENRVIKLSSNRRFSFTEFVKIDTSYLQGEFVYWDAEKETTAIRDFASDHTLRNIRNEILASYGFIFTDESDKKDYVYYDWYKPRYTRYSEFLETMTPIDRYNLEFLEKMIGTLDAKSSA